MGGAAHTVSRDEPTQITEMCPACGKSHRGPTMRCPNYQKAVLRPNTASVPVFIVTQKPTAWWTRFLERLDPKPRTSEEALRGAANRVAF